MSEEMTVIPPRPIGNLAAALAKAQGMMKGATKDAENPAFKRGNTVSKYADLAAVWDACREALSKNELSVVQLVSGGPDPISVTTTLMHSSGEYVSSTMTGRPTKPDVQGIGSTVTYLRRYSLMAIVGIAAEDDDGNAASEPAKNPTKAEVTKELQRVADKAPQKPQDGKLTLELGGGEVTYHGTMTAFLDAFDTALNSADDPIAFFDLNSKTLGEMQAKAAAAKNKAGDAIVQRIKEIHDRIHALSNPDNPLRGA